MFNFIVEANKIRYLNEHFHLAPLTILKLMKWRPASHRTYVSFHVVSPNNGFSVSGDFFVVLILNLLNIYT